jgi:hypothetical protein
MNHCLSNRTRGYLLMPVAVLLTLAIARQAGAEVPKVATLVPGSPAAAAELTATGREDSGRDSQDRGEPSIDDFINAQGSTPDRTFTFGFYQTPFAPHLANYAVGFTTANCPGDFCQYKDGMRIAVVDYAGGANDYLKKHGYGSLNTNTDGSVTQRPLPDGRVEVTVVLHTQNALTFISRWDPNGASPPQNAETNTRLFGSSVSDLLHYRTDRPALADSLLVMVFKQPPNSPMPDLVKKFAFGAYPDLEIVSFYFSVSATGTLPNGSKATARILQHGVFPPPMLINGKPTDPVAPLIIDGGWVSEFVDITPAK